MPVSACILRLTLAFFLVSVFAISSSYAARKTCPPWAAEDREVIDRPFIDIAPDGRRTGDYPSFSKNTYYWKMGVWFEMPLGYRNPWPLEEWANTITNKEDYIAWLSGSIYKGYNPATGAFDPSLIQRSGIDGNFAFWMPSLRWVERNRWFTPQFRPCEAGRPRPTEDNYSVFFGIEWPFIQGSEASQFARPFLNAKKELQETGRLLSQNHKNFEHNLNGPISGLKNYHVYSDDGDLAIKLHCAELWGPTKRAPNPACAGRVWQRSSDLILHIRFPADQGQRENVERWRVPVMQAINLVKSWKR